MSDMINLTEHKMPELLLLGSIKNQAEPCFAPVDHRLFVFSTLFHFIFQHQGSRVSQLNNTRTHLRFSSDKRVGHRTLYQ